MGKPEYSFGNFTLYIPGQRAPIEVASVSLPKAAESEPDEACGLPSDFGFEFEIELSAEQRRNFLVFWIMASALATAGRILD